MDYFECDVPSGNGRCSDNSCPCPDIEIPRGTGYHYVTQSLVDFRRQYPDSQAARNAIQQKHQQMRADLGGIMLMGSYRLVPILVCEQGAKLRNLDLEVAGADAKHWWATGQVPLRATPLASTASKGHASAPADAKGASIAQVATTQRKTTASCTGSEKKWWQFWK